MTMHIMKNIHVTWTIW